MTLREVKISVYLVIFAHTEGTPLLNSEMSISCFNLVQFDEKNIIRKNLRFFIKSDKSKKKHLKRLLNLTDKTCEALNKIITFSNSNEIFT